MYTTRRNWMSLPQKAKPWKFSRLKGSTVNADAVKGGEGGLNSYSVHPGIPQFPKGYLVDRSLETCFTIPIVQKLIKAILPVKARKWSPPVALGGQLTLLKCS